MPCPDLLQATKRLLREDFAKEWVEFCVPEADWGWDLLSSEGTVRALGAVMQQLAGKKAKL